MISFIRSEFLFDLLLFFFMFLSSTCFDIWLPLNLFVRFYDDSVSSIRKKSHIKFLLINMFHYTSNLRYYRHIRITFYIDLEL